MKFLKFIDGKDIADDFNTEYKRHKKGYVLLAPPGAGKSYFISKQTGTDKHWIDSDMIMGPKSLNVQWNNKSGTVDEILGYLRADYMLTQCKMYGYRIMGSLFWEYKADAMVIPPLKLHKKYTEKRKDLDNNNLNKMRQIFRNHAKNNNIPIFNSIKNAVKYLEKKQ